MKLIQVNLDEKWYLNLGVPNECFVGSVSSDGGNGSYSETNLFSSLLVKPSTNYGSTSSLT